MECFGEIVLLQTASLLEKYVFCKDWIMASFGDEIIQNIRFQIILQSTVLVVLMQLDWC